MAVQFKDGAAQETGSIGFLLPHVSSPTARHENITQQKHICSNITLQGTGLFICSEREARPQTPPPLSSPSSAPTPKAK
eukprot:scaffold100361_cov17-Tisochrysis_lutea.AAC.1